MESWLLITNGTVVDGAANPPEPETDVLVRSNRIHSVERGIKEEHVRESIMARGDTLQVLDASRKTVMPGLIDAHCHLSFGHGQSQEEMDLYTGVELRTLRTAASAKSVLRAGVTSMSQPGSSYYIGVGVREAIKEGLVEGPRVFTAGRQMSTSNGIGDYYPDTVGVPDGSIGCLANTPDEMKREVRVQIKNGVDFIKMADSPFGEFQAFTGDEMKMVTELTQQMKRRVTIHARGNDETRAAVQAGVDWIMHSNIMDEQTAGEFGESGILLVPVLTLLANLSDFGEYVGVPPGLRDGCAGMMEASGESYQLARAAGVKFGVGSESGFAITPCGEWHARELQLLVEYAGLSTLEAIQAATQNVAMTVGLDGELGVIAEGMLADIIVVDGDPVRDVRVLQEKENIVAVIKDGDLVHFEDEVELRPFQPAQIYGTGGLLTFETVYGDVEHRAGGLDPLPWNGDDGKSLAGDIKQREKAAGTGVYAMGQSDASR